MPDHHTLFQNHQVLATRPETYESQNDPMASDVELFDHKVLPPKELWAGRP